MVLSLPALCLHIIHECLDKYLLAQRLVQPGVIITTITTALTPVYCYFLIPMYVLPHCYCQQYSTASVPGTCCCLATGFRF